MSSFCRLSSCRTHAQPSFMALLALISLLVPTLLLAQTGVSDDRVSLPEGPGSLEGVGENVEIDPNMGQMRYSVKIKVPPGHAGMTPGVSLSYSSGSGGSVVGMGWSLAMPSIERTTARGLPDYNRDDEFAANGGDQLVRIPNTNPPVYRSRFEKGFVRYRWINAGSGTAGHWKAEHPDGRISYYGATADGTPVPSARVEGITGTFRYHLVETVDPYGHKVVYSYSLFGGNVTLLQHVGWVFDGDTPTYEVSFQYEDRTDLLSDCKPGFNELLTKRLTRVNVFAHGTKIRYYDLAYENYASSGGFSRLTSVQMHGRDGGAYPSHETFTYSRGLGAQCNGNNCQRPYMTSMGSIGGGLASRKATLIDLNGDALPDIVDASQIGPHRIYLNKLAANGDHSFAAPFDSAVATQASHGLGSSSYVQVLDVDGDGRTDMINVQTGQVLKNLGAGDWDATIVPLWNSGNAPFNENDMATMHFIDYDNDKRIDLIRSQGSSTNNITTIYRNTPAGDFVEDTGVEDIGAGFDTDKIELNDMNGDGLLDAVQVSTSEVRYWLNLGRGRWDAQPPISGVSFTDMAQATRAELEDLNGDALADLVLVDGNEIKYWLNRNGSVFDPVQTVVSADIDGDVPVRDANTAVLFADMNGNGSSDIVWIDSNGNVNYLEMFPVRPNLLSKIENGLGKVTEITYGSSVMHMARDREAGHAWSHALPHPMMLVNRYDEYNLLSNVHEITNYVYHEGFYDGAEKQFRGYIRVEQIEPGDASSEPGMALEVYDVGVDDPYRNGLLLSSEIQGESGRSLKLTTNTYADCDVDGVPSTGLTFDVRYICKTSERVELREGRPAAEWVTTEKHWEYDGYGNIILEKDLGVTALGGGACVACASSGYTGEACGAQCLGDEAYVSREYTDPSTNGDRWILRAETRARGYGVADGSGQAVGEKYTETLTYYDGDDFVGLPLGQATHGSVSRVVVRENTAGDTIERRRNRLDAHGNVVESLTALGSPGSNGHRRAWTMDPLGLRVIKTEIFLHNDDGPYSLVRETDFDTTFDLPVEATNWIVYQGGSPQSQSYSRFWAYDEFARVISHTKPGEETGFTTEQYAWTLGNPISKAVITGRFEAGGTLDFEQVLCFDGHGRKYQERTRLAANQYRVTGFTLFNLKGEKQEVFQPYLSTSGDCDSAAPMGTLSVKTHFDALGRRVLRIFPDSDTSDSEDEVIRNTYLPLAEVEYDLEDTHSAGPHANTPRTKRFNGLGRLIADEQLLTPGGSPIVDRYGYDELGNLTTLTDPAGNVRVQTHDLLGQVVALNDPDRGQLTMEYDAAGNLVRRVDATGSVRRFAFEGANRILAEWDEDNEAATRVENTFDMPGNCPSAACTNVAGELAVTTYPLGDGVQGEDRFGYDIRGNKSYLGRKLDGHLFEFRSNYNSFDSVIRNIYPSGLQIDFELYGDGKVARVPGYIDSVHYAANGGADEMLFANGAKTLNAFDVRNHLAAINVLGPAGQVHVAYTYSYDRFGNIVEIEDGRDDDGSPLGGSRYQYDALYRLTQATLDPGRGEHEEVLNYTYNSIGNITAKTSSLGAASPAHVGNMQYGENGAGPHAVTTANTTSIGYDAAGRMTSKGNATFEWDFQGRLTRSVSEVGEVGRYVYARGPQRVIKRENGSTTYFVTPDFEVRDGVATTYLRIGDSRVAKIREADYASQILSDIAPASGDDSAIAAAPDDLITAGDAWIAQAVGQNVLSFAEATEVSSVESLLEASLQRMLAGNADMLSFLHQDHMGGTVAVTNELGLLTERYEYHPYGTERYAMGPGQDYGYSGKESDESTGLIYYGARYYDPWTGRWTTPDPAFEVVEEENLQMTGEASFAYAFNRGNPINIVDQDGHEPITLSIIAIGAISGAAGAAAGALTAAGTNIFKAVRSAARGKTTWSKAGGEVVRALVTGVISATVGGILGAGVGALFAFASPIVAATAGMAVGAVVAGVTDALVGYGVKKTGKLIGKLKNKVKSAQAKKARSKSRTLKRKIRRQAGTQERKMGLGLSMAEAAAKKGRARSARVAKGHTRMPSMAPGKKTASAK